MSKTLTEYLDFKMEVLDKLKDTYPEMKERCKNKLEVLQEITQMIDLGELEGL